MICGTPGMNAVQLVFRAGNIAAHMISRAFIEQLNEGGRLNLPWHLARKQLKTTDETGEALEVEGVKFETFVFDALGSTAASVTLEVERALEFSPVKNAEGADSPATCRGTMIEHFTDIAAGAGAPSPPTDASGAASIEIDPRYAESSDELRSRDQAPSEHAGGHLYR